MKRTAYTACRLCPRRCGVNRELGSNEPRSNKPVQAGYCDIHVDPVASQLVNCSRPPSLAACGESAALRLACASIHWGEEPPLTGEGGSGTIFVSGCNLGCTFCQNYQISSCGLASMPTHKTDFAEQSPRTQTPTIHGRVPMPNHKMTLGRVLSTTEFAEICLTLQMRGAENINIVTGSHAVPAIVEGIAAARTGRFGQAEDRLTIPVLWNSSGYELPETLELLADTVDVFLPDLKTLDAGIAGRYFNAPDYPEAAAAAITKMLEMRPLRFERLQWRRRPHWRRRPSRPVSRDSASSGSSAALVSGVMVRHLVLPGELEASRGVLCWFADHCAGRALLSLMFQYTPLAGREGSSPDRFINRAEYETVLEWLDELGIEDGYCQELVPHDTNWLPDFNKANPFSPELAEPVWHWREGFIPPSA